MHKLVKRHEGERATIHVETLDEKFMRLMNTEIRHLRRQGGSSRITIPPDLTKKLGLEEGDPVRILVFRNFEQFENVKAEFEKMSAGYPFIVLVKDLWRSEEVW